MKSRVGRATSDHSVVLAVDPGSHKCGVAVLDASLRVLVRRVVEAQALVECVRGLIGEHGVTHVVIGDRTGSRRAAEMLRPAVAPVPLEMVDEHLTSLDARARYFRENPPRGLRRLIPLGLQVPPCPIDDYVAVILAERYLAR